MDVEWLTPQVVAVGKALVILVLAWVLLHWNRQMQRILIAKVRKLDRTTTHVLGRLVAISIWVLAIIMILQVFGVNILPLIAFGGIGAAAVAFAGKDVIANFFGGLMLYVTRPFTVGDLVVIPKEQLEGHVEEIGWYLSAVRDREKRLVYLPNALFSSVLVVNCTRILHRRFLETVLIRYQDAEKVEKIVKRTQALLKEHPAIDHAMPVHVSLVSFGDFGLQLTIEAYLNALPMEEHLQVKQEILLKVLGVIQSLDAEIPYPTSVVRVHTQSP